MPGVFWLWDFHPGRVARLDGMGLGEIVADYKASEVFEAEYFRTFRLCLRTG